MSSERIPIEATLVRDTRTTWVVEVQERQYAVEKHRAYYEDGVLYIDADQLGKLGIVIPGKKP